MKVLFYGWYENINVGDESYRLSLPMFFPQYEPTFTNTLTDALVKNTDIIVLGGGNILSRNFLEPLNQYREKPIYAMSVGVSDWSITAKELSIFKRIVVRDKHSFEFIKKLGIKVELAPDSAFLLTPNAENGSKLISQYIKQENIEPLGKKIAVIINSYLPRDGQSQFGRDDFRFQTFSFDFARAVDKIKANFIFIPFGQKHPWDDRVANSWVANKCCYPQKNIICYDRLSVQENLDIIASVDLVISTRLHSTIFALNAGTPFIDILHNDKNKFFVEELTVGETMDYWNFNQTQFLSLIEKILKTPNKEAYKKESEKQKRSISTLPIIQQ